MTRPIITFSKRGGAMPMPHLLDIQTVAFQSLLSCDACAQRMVNCIPMNHETFLPFFIPRLLEAVHGA